MLLNSLTKFGKKPNLETYRSRISLGIIITRISIIPLLYLMFKAHNDLQKGFFVGIVIGLSIYTIYYGRVLRNQEQLKAFYTKMYDERYREVQRLSAVTTLLCLTIIQMALTILYTIWQVTLSYEVVLIGGLYAVIVVFLISRVIWDRIL